jgi:hypothetical protein
VKRKVDIRQRSTKDSILIAVEAVKVTTDHRREDDVTVVIRQRSTKDSTLIAVTTVRVAIGATDDLKVVIRQCSTEGLP